MHVVQSVPAAPALRPYVRAFAQRRVTGVLGSQPMPAFLETVIHFELGDPLTVRSAAGGLEKSLPVGLVGPHTQAGLSLGFDGEIDSFAIFLRPEALWTLFRIPTSVVMDAHYNAQDIFGAPIAELWEVLAEAPDFAGRVRIAEAFLLRRAGSKTGATAATAAASLLMHRGGQIDLPALAQCMNLSVRQLERAFLGEMGISPKRFARVARFQASLDARVRRPDRSWTEIAATYGYHDQMHLIHEFRSLSGMSPTAIVEQLGDSRPPALAASRSWDQR